MERVTELYVASGNAHKVGELQGLLSAASYPVRVAGAERWGGMSGIEETADSFAGNARLKAEALWQRIRQTGGRAWVLADDSGLCVDALGGAPGVYSARYAGPDASDGDNLSKLLRALEGVPAEGRAAKFVCVLHLVDPEGRHYSFEGYLPGFIAQAPLGLAGFGYDPVFVPSGRDQTLAELGAEVKQRISHRAVAFRALIHSEVAKQWAQSRIFYQGGQ